MVKEVVATPAEMRVLTAGECGQNPRAPAVETTSATTERENSHEGPTDLLSAILAPDNLRQAFKRVVRNKGVAGVDGMTVEELSPYLKSHWSSHKEELLNGRYKPQPVLRVEIPKPGGGMRQLGIPTVLDRFIQQSFLQVLSGQFEPLFSESSFGFRPGRSAAQAVQQARDHVAGGRSWVVDLDLDAFFDRVNHDILMSRVRRVVKDVRVVKVIRSYLNAGLMDGGLVTMRKEGTPQGGPLSPLLSNLLLTDLDRELEKRELPFCRYADDCNIYVKSERAGQRVLDSITAYLEKHLKLKVNRKKSGVGRPSQRKFLGYKVITYRQQVRLGIAPEVFKRIQGNLKILFRRGRGQSIWQTVEDLNPKLRGWMAYFRYTDSRSPIEKLDGWVRRHLRKLLWRQWKRPMTRTKRLMQAGLSRETARKTALNGRGAWWCAGSTYLNRALPKRFFDRLGLVSLVDTYHRLKCLM